MINSKHYFDSVEGFLSLHPGVCQVAVLNRLAEIAGCPIEKVDSVINGVISDLIQDNITPQNKLDTVIDSNGELLPDTRINQTTEELILKIASQFEGFTIERAKKLIEYLTNMDVLECDTISGKLYLKKRLARRMLIDFKEKQFSQPHESE